MWATDINLLTPFYSSFFFGQVRATSAFINDPDFSYEKINKSSKACGPLVQWASAQVR